MVLKDDNPPPPYHLISKEDNQNIINNNNDSNNDDDIEDTSEPVSQPNLKISEVLNTQLSRFSQNLTKLKFKILNSFPLLLKL